MSSVLGGLQHRDETVAVAWRCGPADSLPMYGFNKPPGDELTDDECNAEIVVKRQES